MTPHNPNTGDQRIAPKAHVGKAASSPQAGLYATAVAKPFAEAVSALDAAVALLAKEIDRLDGQLQPALRAQEAPCTALPAEAGRRDGRGLPIISICLPLTSATSDIINCTERLKNITDHLVF
jgi:hypothetical protein